MGNTGTNHSSNNNQNQNLFLSVNSIKEAIQEESIVEANYVQQYNKNSTDRQTNYGYHKILRSTISNEKLQQYQIVFHTRDQLFVYLQSYFWRKRIDPRSTPLVKTRYFQCNDDKAGLIEEKVFSCNGGVCTCMVFIEEIPYRLSNIKDIPFPENLYVLRQVLKGFEILYEFIGYVKPFEDLVCINRQGIVKVWLNSNLSKNYPNLLNINENMMNSNCQSKLIGQILQMIEINTDHQNEPISFSEYLKKNCVQLQFINFERIFLQIDKYIEEFQVTVPSVFQSIVEMMNQEDEEYDTYKSQIAEEANQFNEHRSRVDSFGSAGLSSHRKESFSSNLNRSGKKGKGQRSSLRSRRRQDREQGSTPSSHGAANSNFMIEESLPGSRRQFIDSKHSHNIITSHSGHQPVRRAQPHIIKDPSSQQMIQPKNQSQSQSRNSQSQQRVNNNFANNQYQEGQVQKVLPTIPLKEKRSLQEPLRIDSQKQWPVSEQSVRVSQNLNQKIKNSENVYHSHFQDKKTKAFSSTEQVLHKKYKSKNFEDSLPNEKVEASVKIGLKDPNTSEKKLESKQQHSQFLQNSINKDAPKLNSFHSLTSKPSKLSEKSYRQYCEKLPSSHNLQEIDQWLLDQMKSEKEESPSAELKNKDSEQHSNRILEAGCQRQLTSDILIRASQQSEKNVPLVQKSSKDQSLKEKINNLSDRSNFKFGKGNNSRLNQLNFQNQRRSMHKKNTIMTVYDGGAMNSGNNLSEISVIDEDFHFPSKTQFGEQYFSNLNSHQDSVKQEQAAGNIMPRPPLIQYQEEDNSSSGFSDSHHEQGFGNKRLEDAINREQPQRGEQNSNNIPQTLKGENDLQNVQISVTRKEQEELTQLNNIQKGENSLPHQPLFPRKSSNEPSHIEGLMPNLSKINSLDEQPSHRIVKHSSYHSQFSSSGIEGSSIRANNTHGSQTINFHYSDPQKIIVPEYQSSSPIPVSTKFTSASVQFQNQTNSIHPGSYQTTIVEEKYQSDSPPKDLFTPFIQEKQEENNFNDQKLNQQSKITKDYFDNQNTPQLEEQKELNEKIVKRQNNMPHQIEFKQKRNLKFASMIIESPKHRPNKVSFIQRDTKYGQQLLINQVGNEGPKSNFEAISHYQQNGTITSNYAGTGSLEENFPTKSAYQGKQEQYSYSSNGVNETSNPKVIISPRNPHALLDSDRAAGQKNLLIQENTYHVSNERPVIPRQQRSERGPFVENSLNHTSEQNSELRGSQSIHNVIERFNPNQKSNKRIIRPITGRSIFNNDEDEVLNSQRSELDYNFPDKWTIPPNRNQAYVALRNGRFEEESPRQVPRNSRVVPRALVMSNIQNYHQNF